jgi:hypothetical protein
MAPNLENRVIVLLRVILGHPIALAVVPSHPRGGTIDSIPPCPLGEVLTPQGQFLKVKGVARMFAGGVM